MLYSKLDTTQTWAYEEIAGTTFRYANPKDAADLATMRKQDTVAELASAFWKAEYSQPEISRMLGLYQPLNSTGTVEGTTHILVAVIDSKVVGNLTMQVGHGKRRHRGDLTTFTHEDYRRLGIGKGLMFTALEVASMIGVTQLSMEVLMHNEGGMAYAISMGFTRNGLTTVLDERNPLLENTAYVMARAVQPTLEFRLPFPEEK